MNIVTSELKVRTAVRGYHVYQDTWSPVLDEEFACRQDAGNEHDKKAMDITGTEEDEVHSRSQNRCSLHPLHSVNTEKGARLTYETEMLDESTKSRNKALCDE